MSRIISGVNGTCYFLTSLIAIAIVERAGRRPLMLWMAGFQAATMAILAGLYDLSTDEENPNKTAQVFSVLMLFLFNTWFSVGYLGMTWLYPAEVTPLRVRAPANALSTASNWVFNFMVVMATGPMFANIGWGTYAFFAAINAVVILPSVYLFFPGTSFSLARPVRSANFPCRDQAIQSRRFGYHLRQGQHRGSFPCSCFPSP